MKVCKVCQIEFDPDQAGANAAAEMGAFLAKEMYADAGELCPKCLENRGRLAMMYMRDMD